jgi:hypothetical protein
MTELRDESIGKSCPWPPVRGRDPDTGFFVGERPKVFSAQRMAYPPGPGRPAGSNSHESRIGEVWGELTLIELVRRRGRVHYRCQCSCGDETVARWDNIRAGRTMSCGHVGYGLPYSRIGALVAPGRPAPEEVYEERRRRSAEEGQRYRDMVVSA